LGSTRKMQFEPDVHVVHFYISSEHHPTLIIEQSQTKENTVHTYQNLSTNGTHNEYQKLCQSCQPSLLMQFELDVHFVHYYINSEHHPTLFH
jgi:hypothetical protein